MQITFCGAARTVTGSQHLLEINGTRILLDCGTYQGKRAESDARNRTLPFDASSIDAVILSHAHIDHSGNLPTLVKYGFNGEIIATHATRDLCASMLLDSANIQQRDAEYVNKKRARRGEAPVEPIYTEADATRAINSFVGLGYERLYPITNEISVIFHDAGHMLGSAFVELRYWDRAQARERRLIFSGDIGRAGTPIIRDPALPQSADVLIMESTYGDRRHPDFADDAVRMAAIVTETAARGGSVIIPAFAVGRTQAVVYQLHRLMHSGDIPRLPIFVDSPLATNVTETYRNHPECYDDEIRAFITAARLDHDDPFGFAELRYTRTVEQSKALNELTEPAVIIAPSGMMEYGRVLHHLKHRIEDARHTVLVVGFQAEHTLGRKLIDRVERVRIFGEEYDNRIQTELLSGFSGHADQEELLTWVGGLSTPPAHTFLVHGEPPAQDALIAALHARHGITATAPDRLQTVEV